MKSNITDKIQESLFSSILKSPGNQQCADCAAQAPNWVSLDFGVIICINCAGAHRSLGPKFTRVRSIKLDSWNQEQIQLIEFTGNLVANSYWENQIIQAKKPTPNTSPDQLIKFVNDKYIKKLYAQKDTMDPKSAAIFYKEKLKPNYFVYFNQGLQKKQEEMKVCQTLLGDIFDLQHQKVQSSNQSQKGSSSLTQVPSFSSLDIQNDLQRQILQSQSLRFISQYSQQTHINDQMSKQMNPGYQQSNSSQNFEQSIHANQHYHAKQQNFNIDSHTTSNEK